MHDDQVPVSCFLQAHMGNWANADLERCQLKRNWWQQQQQQLQQRMVRHRVNKHEQVITWTSISTYCKLARSPLLSWAMRDSNASIVFSHVGPACKGFGCNAKMRPSAVACSCTCQS